MSLIVNESILAVGRKPDAQRICRSCYRLFYLKAPRFDEDWLAKRQADTSIASLAMPTEGNRVAVKKPKYHNVKVDFDGEVFDSKRELAYYQILLLREKAGEVRNILTKPTIELTPKFTAPTGEKVRASHMIPDFKFEVRDGDQWRTRFVDVKFTERASAASKQKLTKTPAYQIFNRSRKMLFATQGIWIETA